MAERSKAAVLKTVDVKASWGSNPYLPATFYHLKLSNIFRLFLFDFYSANENDNNYQSYLELCLSQSDNFNYSINSDWTNFLKKEDYYKKNQSGSLAMENIKINLDINFVYDKIVE